MRTRRVVARQAHAVPDRAYQPQAIFSHSVMDRGRVHQDPAGIDDGGGHVPPGSTAQNGFREVRWFRCNYCGEVIRETHVDSHDCEE